MFDPVKWKVRVIDWGFACFYFPYEKFDKWPGTRYFKCKRVCLCSVRANSCAPCLIAPELFLHYKYYDFSVDMWAFACVMASIVFQRAPMFRAKQDDNGAQVTFQL